MKDLPIETLNKIAEKLDDVRDGLRWGEVNKERLLTVIEAFGDLLIALRPDQPKDQ